MQRPRRVRRGFSLVELLVVVVMIAFLLALAVPAILRASAAAQKQETKEHLGELLLASHNAAGNNRDRLPPAYGSYGKLESASMHVHLLPYVGEEKLYQKILAKDIKDFADEKVAPYMSPDDPSNTGHPRLRVFGVQNFAGNIRVFSDAARGVKYDQDIEDLKGEHKMSYGVGPAGFPDGTSNTIMFATKYAVSGDGGSRYAAEPSSKFAAFFGQQAAKKSADPADPTAAFQLNPGPKQCRTSPLMAQSFSDKGLWVGMGDGQVRFVSPKIDPKVWNALVHPDDRITTGNDWYGSEPKAPVALSKWEYKVMMEADLLKLGKGNLAIELNRLGDESWELVGFGGGQYIFRRPK